MQRDLYQKLLAWKSDSRRKPLLLRGARQVGKTYILRTFAAQEYTQHIYINFEKQLSLHDFFAKDLNPHRIISHLNTYFDVPIIPGKTLLIFDEIQECPDALNSLKYFQEEASEYHVVAAGSLLGVKLAKSKGFPVGKVNFLDLKPLSFLEFISAIGAERLREFLERLHTKEPISLPIHDQFIDLLKLYYFVGGMPEAVSSYVIEKDLAKVRTIQQSILDAYIADFVKHADKHQVMKITSVWNAIPEQLSKENKKFIFSVLGKSVRGREYEAAIQWLVDAGLIYKSYRISVPRIPLPAYGDQNAFKVFMLDVGLLGAMSHLPFKLITTDNQLFSEFKGAFTENYVAQELRVHDRSALYYWSDSASEVDFVIPHDLQILPLEVKSGVTGKNKSLQKYDEKFQPELLLRASLRNLKQDGKLLNLPLYLVGMYSQFLE